MSTPTREQILAKHLSVDHALQSGLHFTRDMIYEAMEEYAEIVAKERDRKVANKSWDKAIQSVGKHKYD